MDVTVFAKTYKAAASILDPENFDDPVLISGYIKNEDDSRTLIAQSIVSIPRIRAEQCTQVNFLLPDTLSDKELETIKLIVERHPGACQVELFVQTQNKCRVRIWLSDKINPGEEFVSDLEEVLPLKNLLFLYSKSDERQPVKNR
jgi:hypothetical protein